MYINDLDLSIGESKRLNCPSCNGYKTFTVTNNMGQMLWNCYKSSCQLSGSKRVSLSASDIKKHKQTIEKDNEPFVMPEYIIPYDKENYYDIPNDKLMYDVKEHRVVFPVIHEGKVVDANGRSLGKRIPKWKRYGKSDLPFVSGHGKVAVVVEDCVSASVLDSEVYVGVAVLGTSLSESHKRYLSQFSTAIIALDPDALPKTMSFAKELRAYVKDVKVLRLNDDLKYKRKDDIENLINLTPKENQYGTIPTT
tara:strand:- start:1392 stop:2147 length:756 start_codon:yes stop_codon:yes gene_type:complete